MIQRMVSAALLLRDGFTLNILPDTSGTSCTLDGMRYRPVMKSDGYMVLTDLSPGRHTLSIRRKGYQEERIVLNTILGYTIEELVDLKPGAAYPFPGETARVTMNLTSGKTVQNNARIFMGMPLRTKLKLAQAKNAKKTDTIRVFCQGARQWLPVPGYYLTADEDGGEILFVRNLEDETAFLEKAISLSHGRGTELVPVQPYLTNEDGCVHAIFRNAGDLYTFCDGKWKKHPLKSGEQSLTWNLADNK